MRQRPLGVLDFVLVVVNQVLAVFGHVVADDVRRDPLHVLAANGVERVNQVGEGVAGFCRDETGGVLALDVRQVGAERRQVIAQHVHGVDVVVSLVVVVVEGVLEGDVVAVLVVEERLVSGQELGEEALRVLGGEAGVGVAELDRVVGGEIRRFPDVGDFGELVFSENRGVFRHRVKDFARNVRLNIQRGPDTLYGLRRGVEARGLGGPPHNFRILYLRRVKHVPARVKAGFDAGIIEMHERGARRALGQE